MKVCVFAMSPFVPEAGRFFKPLRAFPTAGGAPRPQALRAIVGGGR
ncbi:hypothetical protein [uncultured Ruegeria sp.]|nr:hypothetical protein [uncultured Ruegeria sp.]